MLIRDHYRRRFFVDTTVAVFAWGYRRPEGDSTHESEEGF